MIVAKNPGRDGEVIVSLRTLRRMGAIPDEWPKINTAKFQQWDEELFNNLDTEYEEEINRLIAEDASPHDIDCEEVRHRLIKKHLKVFADELNGNVMIMEPVSVKLK